MDDPPAEPDITIEEAILVRLGAVEAALARMEDLISRYEPLLAEAARRMQGPLRWRKDGR